MIRHIILLLSVGLWSGSAFASIPFDHRGLNSVELERLYLFYREEVGTSPGIRGRQEFPSCATLFAEASLRRAETEFSASKIDRITETLINPEAFEAVRNRRLVNAIRILTLAIGTLDETPVAELLPDFNNDYFTARHTMVPQLEELSNLREHILNVAPQKLEEGEAALANVLVYFNALVWAAYSGEDELIIASLRRQVLMSLENMSRLKSLLPSEG